MFETRYFNTFGLQVSVEKQSWLPFALALDLSFKDVSQGLCEGGWISWPETSKLILQDCTQQTENDTKQELTWARVH